MDYSKITLGNLLSSVNDIIRKHALGILKQLQKDNKRSEEVSGACYYGNHRFCMMEGCKCKCHQEKREKCSACGGTGNVDEAAGFELDCGECKGIGWIEK